MSLSQLVNNMRWAMNVKRARIWRRKLTFTQRQVFDDELRPRLTVSNSTFAYPPIAYPEAFYEITADDLCRAIVASSCKGD